MTTITALEAQHHALAGMMLRLVNQVQGYQRPEQACSITLQLATLANLLRFHLTAEDEWFYPAMIGSDEPLAVSLATTYRDEVGGIAEEVEVFLRQWNNSVVIDVGAARFREEMLGLFHKIEDRIGREDLELYPLARSLGIDIRPLAA